MCEPISATTLAYATLATAGAAAGVSAYGQIQQGKAASRSAEYQAKIAENNARVAEWQARDAEDRGAEAEVAKRREVAAMIGRQRATLAANGLDTASGSPLDILSDTAQFGELDALTIRQNAAREAWGLRTQGANFTADAALRRMEGRDARAAGTIGASSSLLGGASQAASGWYNMSGTGGSTAALRRNRGT